MRREALEDFVRRAGAHHGIELSTYTRDRAEAQGWLDNSDPTGSLDGVVAKRLDGPYVSGERAMLKIKRIRTADCVVGGFRYGTGSTLMGSILLGLYDDAGLLHHVGFSSSFSNAEKPELTKKLEALRGGPGFTGRAPGRAEPLVDRPHRDLRAAAPRARGRGGVRPRNERPLPPRLDLHPLAARQGAGAVHDGTAWGIART